MVLDSLIHTEVLIPIEQLHRIAAIAPNVPSDIGMRKMAMVVAGCYFSKSDPNGDYPYKYPNCVGLPDPNDGLEPDIEWPYESERVTVLLPERVVNKLTVMTLMEERGYAILMSILYFLDDPAKFGWRVR